MIRNITQNTVAGAVLGVLDVASDYLVYGTPLYGIVESLGRYGKGVTQLVLGFSLGFVADRVEVLRSLAIPERFWVLGVYNVVKAAAEKAMGAGFAVVTKDGTIKFEEEDTVQAAYIVEGGAVKMVETGSATGGFGINRYVIIGHKNVYYVMSPYKLSLRNVAT